ncbi:MAG: hypothetical protein IT193_11310 [Propionibacteriaceae bacterium]|nr:hypothetical protein [Propionibacteriaceae bacterium]
MALAIDGVRGLTTKGVNAGAVIIAAAGFMSLVPVGASADTRCPGLGTVEEAVSWFTERGFPSHDLEVSDAGVTWNSSTDHSAVAVTGQELADSVSIDAHFTGSESEATRSWSIEELEAALDTAVDLMVEFGDTGSLPESFVIRDLVGEWPGRWGLDLPDRDGEMLVILGPEGLRVSAEMRIKADPQSSCNQRECVLSDYVATAEALKGSVDCDVTDGTYSEFSLTFGAH